MLPPKIDSRTMQDLIRKMEEMVPYYTPEWRFSAEEPDPGAALFMIFAEMFQENIKRFNQVPYKQFIAFLNTLDVSLLSSQSAYAYLTFKLSNGAEESIYIPSGTQVTASVITDEQEEILFETDRHMLITPAKLEKAFITSGRLDRVILVPEQCLRESRENPPASFNLFETERSENLQDHGLYLAHPYLFNIHTTAQVEVSLYHSNMKYEEHAMLTALADPSLVEWLYQNDEQWVAFDEVYMDQERLYLRKNTFGELMEQSLFETSGRWIQCRVKPGSIHRLLDRAEEFALDEIMIKVDYYDPSDHGGIEADKIYFDDTEVAREGFYPFGEFFAPYSTLYISSQEVFSKKEGKISLTFDLTVKQNVMQTADDPDVNWKLIMKEKDLQKQEHPRLSITQVIWEYWDGYTWARLTTDPQYEQIFYKPEGGLKKIEFDCPLDMDVTFVNGQENFWIRARVVHMDQMLSNNLVYLSPWLENVKMTYTYDKRLYPEHCLTYNNLQFLDETAYTKRQANAFRPFIALDNMDPSIYMSFDEAPKKGPVSLYVSLERKFYSDNQMPTIEWEYLRKRGTTFEWGNLKVLDQTRHMTRSGMVQFIGPDDFVRHTILNEHCFWIRAVNKDLKFEPPYDSPLPKVQGIYLNTVRAIQQETIYNEFPDPVYAEFNWEYELVHQPVLTAEVWVDEIGHITEDELLELQLTHEIKVMRDSEGNLQKCSVQWEKVGHFLTSRTSDRHYVLNAGTGRIRFGDGKQGKVPPNQGSEYINVKYSVGGGLRGNIPRYEITNLQNALAYVQSVYNPEPAVGGADMESMDEAIKRGPQIFKHRHRAVTAEDFEWLARQQFQHISKIKCLPNVNAQLEKEPGTVTMVVLPKGNLQNSDLFVELKPQLEHYLLERAAGPVAFSERIHVIEPAYLEISVNVTLKVKSMDDVLVTENAAKQKIEQFLNPYNGHYDGNGWEIGEDIHPSLFYSLLKSIDAVNHIEKLFMHVIKVDKGIGQEVDAYQLVHIKHGMIQNGQHKVTVEIL